MARHSFSMQLLFIFLPVLFLTVTDTAQAQTLTITPTTTLTKELANNTSASSNFGALTNGNTRPGNVSKSAHSALLYSGNTTKVYAHYMGWFGTDSHINVGYASNSQETVHNQVADMKSRGISGAILDWYGQGTITDQNGGEIKHERTGETAKPQFPY